MTIINTTNFIFAILLLLLLLTSCNQNHSPVIENVYHNSTVATGSKTTITVWATDSDDDSLIYHWYAANGHVPSDNHNPGETITYTAPMIGGLDTITVIVTDGNEDVKKEIKIAVEEIPTPIPTHTYTPPPTFTSTPLPTVTPPSSPTPTNTASATPTTISSPIPTATLVNTPTLTPFPIINWESPPAPLTATPARILTIFPTFTATSTPTPSPIPTQTLETLTVTP